MSYRLRTASFIFCAALMFFALSAGAAAANGFEADGTETLSAGYTEPFSATLFDEEPELYTLVSPHIADPEGLGLNIYQVPGSSASLGIDVSHWQEEIDWEKVAAEGVQFAIIRVGHRRASDGEITEDRTFRENIEGARANGIKVGVYIYSQAITAAMAEEEAAYVLDRVAGYDLDLPVVLDYEFASNSGGKTGILWNGYQSGRLDRDKATDVCLAFCDFVRERGYSPMVYANFSMFTHYLDFTRIREEADIWLARYNNAPEHQGNYLTDIDFWQYSNTGWIDGIKGPVDCDFGFGSKLYHTVKALIPFTDVKTKNWFFDDVRCAYDNDLFKGVDATHFAPNVNMSRAMLVTVLYRLEGEPAVDGDAPFSDLTADWYRPAVNWAAANGIVYGYSPEIFDPDRDISREEMASILWRYAAWRGFDTSATASLSSFGDGNRVSNYASAPMSWAVTNGYIAGFPDGTLCPREGATRAQVASVLRRFRAAHEGDYVGDPAESQNE